MIHSLFILNRAGGLIYQQEFSNNLSRLSANDYLVLAGTLHGVHAIASQLTPIKQNSLQNLINNFALANNSSVTNTLFIGSSSTNIGSSSNNNNNTAGSGPGSGSASGFKYTNANSGLNMVKTEFFNIYIFQTLTGIKFMLIATPHSNESQMKLSLKSTGNLVNETADKLDELSIDRSLDVMDKYKQISIKGDTNNAQYSGSSSGRSGKSSKLLASQESSVLAEQILRNIYGIYSDYVMKNPFYSLDMPIKADLFDTRVKQFIGESIF